MNILTVAFPFAPMGPDAVGGAEQIAATIDRALVAAGHRSIVIARVDSETAGELRPIPMDEQRARTHARTQALIAESQAEADLIHFHGLDFASYLPPPGKPALATLHLPPAWYDDAALHPKRPQTWLHAVSFSQHDACPPDSPMLPPILNGVALDSFAHSHARRRHAILLGRICPEKGQHLGIEAAKRADIPLLIGGAVFPYEAHQTYFDREVAPHLDAQRRFLGPLKLARKRRLLASARCLLIPSLAPETSSLVAMEALACGTPVIAFRTGALPEIVEPGKTGFLVESASEMADAIAELRRIDPQTCRREARARFCARRMAAEYLQRYAELA